MSWGVMSASRPTAFSRCLIAIILMFGVARGWVVVDSLSGWVLAGAGVNGGTPLVAAVRRVRAPTDTGGRSEMSVLEGAVLVLDVRLLLELQLRGVALGDRAVLLLMVRRMVWMSGSSMVRNLEAKK